MSYTESVNRDYLFLSDLFQPRISNAYTVIHCYGTRIRRQRGASLLSSLLYEDIASRW